MLSIPKDSCGKSDEFGAPIYVCRMQGAQDYMEDGVGFCQVPAEYFQLPELERKQLLLKTCKELNNVGRWFPETGSTLSAVLITKNADGILDLDTVQVGDSESLLASEYKNIWTFGLLSPTHKFTNSFELKRLQDFRKESGCNSWFSDSKKNVIPEEKIHSTRIAHYNAVTNGLGMTRSMGDRLLNVIGIINNPEIRTYNIKSIGTKVLCLYTDGVSDGLSIEQITSTLFASIKKSAGNPAWIVCNKALQSKKNKRKDNASAIVCQLDQLKPHSSIALLVVDGHVGSQVADYILSDFLPILTKNLQAHLEQKQKTIIPNTGSAFFQVPDEKQQSPTAQSVYSTPGMNNQGQS
jgi:serine/threonine protein phosphatase PrpC